MASKLGKADWPFLYHWSPATRRAQIMRYGLRPGMWSIDRVWRPPHVCLAPSPGFGWRLSGAMHPEIAEWDLWEVWTGSILGWEVLKLADQDTAVEIRVFRRIYKRDVELIAHRSHQSAR